METSTFRTNIFCSTKYIHWKLRLHFKLQRYSTFYVNWEHSGEPVKIQLGSTANFWSEAAPISGFVICIYICCVRLSDVINWPLAKFFPFFRFSSFLFDNNLQVQKSNSRKINPKRMMLPRLADTLCCTLPLAEFLTISPLFLFVLLLKNKYCLRNNKNKLVLSCAKLIKA